MKGIILAGGSGTRLYPITEGVSKQLMPIYDKPMIFYPLSTLMLAGIRDILVITTEDQQPGFKNLLGDGSKFGVNLQYKVQPSPDGLAQAFILGEEFIGDDACAMILGDNIFHGDGLTRLLTRAVANAESGYATNFGFRIRDPERFGIMEFDEQNNIIGIEEKPKRPKSDFAVTGIYFYPSGVATKAKQIQPSERGELEITTLNNMYLKEQRLKGELLGSGFSWFDTGTFDSEMDAAVMIRAIENNQNRVISCPEQIAFDRGWITREQLTERAELLGKNSYGVFLRKILENSKPSKTSTKMSRIDTNLKDCYILEPARFGDARGYYSPVHIEQELSKLGFEGVKQISRSKSGKGILRGMHFQKGKYAQAKIVEVIQGSVIDVVVDMRKDSPTYRQWTSALLTPDNNRQLYVPRGFAHGFLSLEDNTIFQYFVDNDYAPEQEDGIAYDDPEIKIDWKAIFDKYDIVKPILSEKDQHRHTLTEYEKENS